MSIKLSKLLLLIGILGIILSVILNNSIVWWISTVSILIGILVKPVPCNKI